MKRGMASQTFRPLPTQKYLLECLDYKEETGELFWKERPLEHFSSGKYPERNWKAWNSNYSGTQAFKVNNHGYYSGTLDSTVFLAHRIIYKLIHGVDPDRVLHAKGETLNNCLENISSGSHSLNMLDKKKYKNCKSGVMGVTWHTRDEVWAVRIRINKKETHLGYFDDLQEAIAVRKAAEVQYGYHPNHGNR